MSSYIENRTSENIQRQYGAEKGPMAVQTSLEDPEDVMNSESYQNQYGVENSQTEQTGDDHDNVTNEYVLNVAFWTFLFFMALEAVFAIIAGSQSMLEDAEAMSVDALTYLFNLWAEKIKHRPLTEDELKVSPEVREYRRELIRLYLELIPPALSVCTLVAVTIYAIRDALATLNNAEAESEEDVDVNIMIVFSGANLLLDFVNVACFARAHQAFGLAHVRREHSPTRYSMRDIEMERLLGEDNGDSPSDLQDGIAGAGERLLVNLNMCSAWTHVCADTLRSTAVLVAAMIAYFFKEHVTGALADSLAAIVVSIIILVSLVPLFHGLFNTAKTIIKLSTESQRPRLDV